MGEHDIRTETDTAELRLFMQRVLDDVQALERMIEEEMFETGVTRMGAEQELFLVETSSHRPSMRAMEVLKRIDDPHFTTELGKFNLECNLDPFVIGPGCLRDTETQLRELLDLARRCAHEEGAEVALIGILPTLAKDDLSLDNMAPIPRYFALADAMRELRGREFELHIKGRDEVKVRHDNVMLEACNTSFQIHLQVTPANFAHLYNIAQAVAAPTLAAATFSPLLFGRQLWAETRIAVFQQAVDTRHGNCHHRQQRPRVRFGEHWVDESVLEIFRQDISNFRLILTRELGENPLDQLDRGQLPDLEALRLHNGTVYRWNRACYGLSGDKPHLRIENRILPSGPTILDEMANAAFWYGLMLQLPQDLEDVRRLIPFDGVKENFLAAARLGLRAQFRWIDGKQYPAQDLILQELLPRSRAGLESAGLEGDEIDRYLPVLEARCRNLRTGTRWVVDSLTAMSDAGTRAERLACLTADVVANQWQDLPVHTWPLVEGLRRDTKAWHRHYARIGDLMTTDLFTVTADEVIDLVASLMDWKYIHHVPVEDSEHRLVGLVTHRKLLRFLAHNQGRERRPVAVREVMETDLVTVTPNTPTLEAIRMMEQNRISCLPVVDGDLLAGIVTEHDFLRVADKLLKDFLED